MTDRASDQQVHDLWQSLNRETRERQALALQQSETMGKVALVHQRLDTMETSMQSHRTESRQALDHLQQTQQQNASQITQAIETLRQGLHDLDKEHATNKGEKVKAREMIGWMLAIASILVAAFSLVN